MFKIQQNNVLINGQKPKPVVQPVNRLQHEEMQLKESQILIKDFQGNYIEYCLDEIRLKDLNNQQYDQQLFQIELQKPKNQFQQDATIQTKISCEMLKSALKQDLSRDKINNLYISGLTDDIKVSDAQTVDFQLMRLSQLDTERRNEERGLRDDSI